MTTIETIACIPVFAAMIYVSTIGRKYVPYFMMFTVIFALFAAVLTGCQAVKEVDGHTVHMIRLSAEQGDVTAQASLGGMYFEGKGVASNYAQAASWFRKAAEQGHAWSQFTLGAMYREGLGVPRDDAQAVSWTRKAAEQGLAGAQGDLGWMYLEGKGVASNYAQAVSWLRKSAGQGLAASQAALGMIYFEGKVTQRNYVAAYQWLNLAAAQGFEDADKALKALKKKMTPRQIAKAKKQIAELLAAHPNAVPE